MIIENTNVFNFEKSQELRNTFVYDFEGTLLTVFVYNKKIILQPFKNFIYNNLSILETEETIKYFKKLSRTQHLFLLITRKEIKIIKLKHPGLSVFSYEYAFETICEETRFKNATKEIFPFSGITKALYNEEKQRIYLFINPCPPHYVATVQLKREQGSLSIGTFDISDTYLSPFALTLLFSKDSTWTKSKNHVLSEGAFPPRKVLLKFNDIGEKKLFSVSEVKKGLLELYFLSRIEKELVTEEGVVKSHKLLRQRYYLTPLLAVPKGKKIHRLVMIRWEGNEKSSRNNTARSTNVQDKKMHRELSDEMKQALGIEDLDQLVNGIESTLYKVNKHEYQTLSLLFLENCVFMNKRVCYAREVLNYEGSLGSKETIEDFRHALVFKSSYFTNKRSVPICDGNRIVFGSSFLAVINWDLEKLKENFINKKNCFSCNNNEILINISRYTNPNDKYKDGGYLDFLMINENFDIYFFRFLFINDKEDLDNGNVILAKLGNLSNYVFGSYSIAALSLKNVSDDQFFVNFYSDNEKGSRFVFSSLVFSIRIDSLYELVASLTREKLLNKSKKVKESGTVDLYDLPCLFDFRVIVGNYKQTVFKKQLTLSVKCFPEPFDCPIHKEGIEKQLFRKISVNSFSLVQSEKRFRNSFLNYSPTFNYRNLSFAEIIQSLIQKDLNKLKEVLQSFSSWLNGRLDEGTSVHTVIDSNINNDNNIDFLFINTNFIFLINTDSTNHILKDKGFFEKYLVEFKEGTGFIKQSNFLRAFRIGELYWLVFKELEIVVNFEKQACYVRPETNKDESQVMNIFKVYIFNCNKTNDYFLKIKIIKSNATKLVFTFFKSTFDSSKNIFEANELQSFVFSFSAYDDGFFLDIDIFVFQLSDLVFAINKAGRFYLVIFEKSDYRNENIRLILKTCVCLDFATPIEILLKSSKKLYNFSEQIFGSSLSNNKYLLSLVENTNLNIFIMIFYKNSLVFSSLNLARQLSMANRGKDLFECVTGFYNFNSLEPFKHKKQQFEDFNNSFFFKDVNRLSCIFRIAKMSGYNKTSAPQVKKLDLRDKEKTIMKFCTPLQKSCKTIKIIEVFKKNNWHKNYLISVSKFSPTILSESHSVLLEKAEAKNIFLTNYVCYNQAFRESHSEFFLTLNVFLTIINGAQVAIGGNLFELNNLNFSFLENKGSFVFYSYFGLQSKSSSTDEKTLCFFLEIKENLRGFETSLFFYSSTGKILKFNILKVSKHNSIISKNKKKGKSEFWEVSIKPFCLDGNNASLGFLKHLNTLQNSEDFVKQIYVFALKDKGDNYSKTFFGKLKKLMELVENISRNRDLHVVGAKIFVHRLEQGDNEKEVSDLKKDDLELFDLYFKESLTCKTKQVNLVKSFPFAEEDEFLVVNWPRKNCFLVNGNLVKELKKSRFCRNSAEELSYYIQILSRNKYRFSPVF